MLRGRVHECAAIDELLCSARHGEGGGILLHGEPGIGKTALLDYAADCASDMRVLRCAGVEPERDFGYATLHQLLQPLVDWLDDLPSSQAHALKVVFGHVDGPPADRFLVALATLSLVSRAADQMPVLCLIDDGQWVDQPSRDVFTFLARRLVAEPVALAMAFRSDGHRAPTDLPGTSELPLVGLDDSSAHALLIDQIGEQIPSAQQAVVLRACGGNPLAIRELSSRDIQSVRSGAPLRTTDELRRAFHERVRLLRPNAQRLLLLTACEGSGQLDVVRRAAQNFPVELDAFTSGELDSVLTIGATKLAFRHPLIRSAIYYGASPGERRAAHRALAAAFADQPDEFERRAWHLGQAAERPDESVAIELERSAARVTGRAGPAAAAAILTQAVALTTSDARKVSRLVTAAQAWWHSGDSTRAEALLSGVEHHPASTQAARRDAAGLRALIEVRTGIPADAAARLSPIVADALREDLPRGIELLMLLCETIYDGNAADVEIRMAAVVEELTLKGAGHPELMARLFRGAHRARLGAEPGLAPGDLEAAEQLTDPSALTWAGSLLWAQGHSEYGAKLHRRAVESARSLGAAGVLPSVLEDVIVDELTHGNLPVAEAYATEGHEFALETKQPNMACRHQGLLSLLAALRGRHQDAERLAGNVLVEAHKHQLLSAESTARRALGIVHLAAGSPETALNHMTAIYRESNSRFHEYMVSFAPEVVEAAVRAGQPDRVSKQLIRFIRWAESTGSPHLSALVARFQALLGSGDRVESEYRRSLALHRQTDNQLARAQTELLFGRYLRRERRKSDARLHLHAALDIFQRLDVQAWADLVRNELQATGEAVRPRAAGALHSLTPQETRIALAVAAGTRTREIAAQLFISPRTVEYHVRKIFQKTGLQSRADLIRLVLAEREQGPSPR